MNNRLNCYPKFADCIVPVNRTAQSLWLIHVMWGASVLLFLCRTLPSMFKDTFAKYVIE